MKTAFQRLLAPAISIVGIIHSAEDAMAQIDPPVIVPDRERFAPLVEAERDDPLALIQSAPSAPPDGSEAVFFELRRVAVEGDFAARSEESVLEYFSDLIGRRISVADVFAAAQRLENDYRAAGFITSRIVVPAQQLDDGVFRIIVIEGFIDNVAVTGDVGAVKKTIEGIGRRTLSSRPVSNADLESFALLASDLPGVSGQSVLRPAAGADAIGGSDLEFVAQRKKYEAFFSVDNRGSQVTGPWAFFAGATMNSHTRFAESLGVTLYSTIDFDEQIVGQVNYSQLVGLGALRVGGAVSVGRTDSGAPLDGVGFESESLVGSFFVERPLRRSARFSAWANLTASFANAETFRGRFPQDPDDAPDRISFFEDRTRIISGSLRWRANQPRANGWGTAISGVVRLTQGLDILNATPDLPDDASAQERFERSRENGTASFTSIDGEVFVTQETSGPLRLFARIGGQWASDPLLAIEEFQIGGPRFARGYEPAQVTGDSAVGASLELQADATSAVSSWLGVEDALDDFSAYTFFDAGVAFNNLDGILAENLSQSSVGIASAGVGVRTRWLDHAIVDLEAAFPFDDPVRFDRNNDYQFFLRVAFFR